MSEDNGMEGPGMDMVVPVKALQGQAELIQRLQAHIQHLSRLLDQQNGTPCEQVRHHQEVQDLKDALAAFAHPDLSEMLIGHMEGDATIIFQRIRAKLTIGDFRRAAELVKN